MKKFWYFVAIIATDNWEAIYEGYVGHSDGFFPIKSAKLQAVDYGGIPIVEIPEGVDKKVFMNNTSIINQIEVTEQDFEAWKIRQKF